MAVTKRDRALRPQVLQRDDFTCQKCGLRLDEAFLHVDHVTPLWAGGKDELSNLQTLDSRCHKIKTKREATQRARWPRWRRCLGVALIFVISRGFFLSLLWMAWLRATEGPAAMTAFAVQARDFTGHVLFLVLFFTGLWWLCHNAPAWMLAPETKETATPMRDPHAALRTEQQRIERLIAKVDPDITPNCIRTATGDLEQVTIPCPPGSPLRDNETRENLHDELNRALHRNWALDYDPVRDVAAYWDRPDPLAEITTIRPVPETVDWDRGVLIGRFDDGSDYWLPLLGNHLAVGGMTGSGKGSVIWTIVHELASAIRDRLVEVIAIDAKGGVELGPGKQMWKTFARSDMTKMVAALEAAVTAMTARAEHMERLGLRKLTRPTPTFPLVLLLVDEVAFITAFSSDAGLKKRALNALSALLSQGRAVGYCVVVATQEPSKESMQFRGLVPTRICLRVKEAMHVTMVLGEGSRARGARADRIPKGLPGVGYAETEDDATPRRFRAPFVTDDDITALARDYAPAV